jgi:hypothetical protein
LLLGALIGSALLIAAFGLVISRLDIALWTALLLGIIANAAMAGLYAIGRGWLPAQLYLFFSTTFVVAAVAIFLIGPARARASRKDDFIGS